MRLFSRLALGAVVLAVLAGCGTEQTTTNFPYKQIALPTSEYFGLAWVPSLGMVVERSGVSSKGSPSEVFLAVSEAGKVHRIDLPRDNRCTRTDYRYPSTLPGGRLGFVKTCFGVRKPTTDVLAMQASEGVKELIEMGLRPASFSWKRGLDEVVFSRSSELCAGIAVISGGKTRFFDTRIEDDGKGFSLDEEFERESVLDSCEGTGLAAWPAWSPDGQRIAFFASPAAVGLSLGQRPASPWNLYSMRPDGSELETLLEDIWSPRSLVWSRDGRVLAFGGDVDGGGKGLWLLNVQTGGVDLQADRPVSWAAWSPRGDKIAFLSPASSTPTTLMDLYVVAVQKGGDPAIQQESE